MSALETLGDDNGDDEMNPQRSRPRGGRASGTSAPPESALADSGVAHEYEHIEKLVRAEPRLTLYDAVLKWYDIAPGDEPVPLAIRALARRNLRDASKAGELGLGEGLGFVILHRCGESFYFLLVCTWRNENELWETVWAKKDAGDHAFRPWPIEGPHRPTFCVWELAAVCHEREAWSDFLRSPRGERDKEIYLRSAFAGAA